MKSLLLINKNYELSEYQKDVVEQLKSSSEKKYKVKQIHRGKLSSKVWRQKFEEEIARYQTIILLDVFHITIDFRYLKTLFQNKELYILKNSDFDISVFFSQLFVLEKDIGYFEKIDFFNNQLNEFNKFLKASVQKIGREKKKLQKLANNKDYKFGRPKNTREVSQYDDFKEFIRYRLDKKKMTPTQIHKELRFGSVTALRYYIKTRFQKQYF